MPQAERPDTELRFPLGGMDRADAFGKQPARPIGTDPITGKKVYVATSRFGQNVRAFEPLTNRARGGSRQGLGRTKAGAVVAGWLVQGLGTLSNTEVNVQSISGRFVTVVAVSKGVVYYARPDDTVWTQATNLTGNTPPLVFTGIVRMASCVQKLWFADGANAAYFDPVDNSVHTWTATAGTLPASGANRPRLICTWRGRVVQSGLLGDPQNWFMSRVNVPTDYDYAPLSPSATQAVAGNNSKQGQLGDVIQALAPYNDDLLVMGGSQSLWQMRGDPMDNGSLDLITDAIGMAWGDSWCLDPGGAMYFVASRPAIYRMEPGSKPVRISQPVERLLAGIDTGANSLTMKWDDREQALKLFVTPLAAPAVTTHFTWEARTGAWWTDAFANNNHNPLVATVLEGNTAAQRLLLIGSWDGYVRSYQDGQTTDDGTNIESEVVIGPILTSGLDDVMFNEIQGVLAEEGGTVDYEVRVGKTAEAALASDPVVKGTWKPGRNFTRPVRRAAHALYVTLRSTNAWAIEAIRATVEPRGMVRRRNR
jgi:hypothetical protein